jgi:hypothetical protein
MSAKNKIKIGDIVAYKHDRTQLGYVCGHKSNMVSVIWFHIHESMLHFKSQLIKVS